MRFLLILLTLCVGTNLFGQGQNLLYNGALTKTVNVQNPSTVPNGELWLVTSVYSFGSALKTSTNVELPTGVYQYWMSPGQSLKFTQNGESAKITILIYKIGPYIPEEKYNADIKALNEQLAQMRQDLVSNGALIKLDQLQQLTTERIRAETAELSAEVARLKAELQARP